MNVVAPCLQPSNMTIDTISSTVIDDIEDALPAPLDQRPVRSGKQEFIRQTSGPTAAVPEHVKRTVPGVQTVYVRTFGCSHNQSDSEYMMGILQAYGYRCVAQQPTVWCFSFTHKRSLHMDRLRTKMSVQCLFDPIHVHRFLLLWLSAS